MSLAVRNLSVLAYVDGFTLWHYEAPGATLAEVTARGYFNDTADMLAAGDVIMLCAEDGFAMRAIRRDGGHAVLVPSR